MSTKIALIGIMGHGKSSVGNLFVGFDYFKVSNDVYTCTIKTESYNNGDIEIFDTQGLNDKGQTDANNLQEMIKTFKKEKLNAIFIVLNGQVPRIDEGIKQVIREICKLFMGKYIWKQIGLIFTHFGYDEEQQDEVKQREKNYVKEVLKTAEEEYQEIIKNQDENNRTCDPEEKIVDNLKCFYVNAKRKKSGNFDADSLEEIKKIKKFAKKCPPINKVQSKFIVKKELLKDQKGDISNVLKKEKDQGFVAGLKTAGCYALGVVNLIGTPAHLAVGGVSKLIGLPFDDDSLVNVLANTYLEMPKNSLKLFNEIPDELNTKITGSESHYDIFDLEKTYWSDKSVTQKIFNVRHQVV